MDLFILSFNNIRKVFNFTEFYIITMDKDQLLKIISDLKNNSIDFKLDTHINGGNSFIRGILLKHSSDTEKVKKIISNEALRNFKIRKSKIWYLGDEHKAVLLKLKREIEISIPELEKTGINNHK